MSGNLGEFDYLTPQDIRVCACIETFTDYDYGYHGKTEYTFNAKAISALIGHPLVFWEDSPTTRMEIVKGEPELIVKKGKRDRQKLLFGLQPFDMLVCSYGLLQQEEVSQMLSQVQWQTIVLDEAQAIKNMTTKRSQAAMNLKGGFKLITTGTPIENHLGELWNLFRFINPGLLGSFESFNQRFAIPIEKFQDKSSTQQTQKTHSTIPVASYKKSGARRVAFSY